MIGPGKKFRPQAPIWAWKLLRRCMRSRSRTAGLNMQNANWFRDKLGAREVCVGTGICFTDPTVTEALCAVFDFIWIDMEHNALSLESVQGHIIATKGTRTTPLVRVPW